MSRSPEGRRRVSAWVGSFAWGSEGGFELSAALKDLRKASSSASAWSSRVWEGADGPGLPKMRIRCSSVRATALVPGFGAAC